MCYIVGSNKTHHRRGEGIARQNSLSAKHAPPPRGVAKKAFWILGAVCRCLQQMGGRAAACQEAAGEAVPSRHHF